MAVPMKGTGERMSLKSPSIITCCSSALLGLLDKRNPSKQGGKKKKTLCHGKLLAKGGSFVVYLPVCSFCPLFFFFFSLSVPAVSLNKLV